jgi:hypothetical protein
MFKVGNCPNSGSDAAVPAEIRPGTQFSAPYITILASINARLDLLSGTTARDLSSGSTAGVDLRNAINEGLIPGPRQEPDRGVTTGVAPQQVEVAVAVEVALPDDGPGRRHRSEAADAASANRPPSFMLPFVYRCPNTLSNRRRQTRKCSKMRHAGRAETSRKRTSHYWDGAS